MMFSGCDEFVDSLEETDKSHNVENTLFTTVIVKVKSEYVNQINYKTGLPEPNAGALVKIQIKLDDKEKLNDIASTDSLGETGAFIGINVTEGQKITVISNLVDKAHISATKVVTWSELEWKAAGLKKCICNVELLLPVPDE